MAHEGGDSFNPFRTWKHAAFFIGAVFVATVLMNTLLNHLPSTIGGPLAGAQRGF